MKRLKLKRYLAPTGSDEVHAIRKRMGLSKIYTKIVTPELGTEKQCLNAIQFANFNTVKLVQFGVVYGTITGFCGSVFAAPIRAAYLTHDQSP